MIIMPFLTILDAVRYLTVYLASSPGPIPSFSILHTEKLYEAMIYQYVFPTWGPEVKSFN